MKIGDNYEVKVPTGAGKTGEINNAGSILNNGSIWGQPGQAGGIKIGETVKFEAEDGGTTSLRPVSTKGDTSKFNVIEAEIVSDDEHIVGEIVGFHPDRKIFIVKTADGTRHTINAVSYEDTRKALEYLIEADNDPQNRTTICNQKYI